MTPKFSWPQYRSPWELGVAVTNLGDGDCGSVQVNDVLRRVRLDEVDSWSSLSLGLQLGTTEAPPVTFEATHAYVLVSSTRTNTRVPVPLTGSDQHYSGSVTLSRDILAGAVKLTAYVVAGDNAHVVGESPEWTLVVDASAAPLKPGTPPFDVTWLDFTESSHQILATAKDSYSVMDLSQPKPVLYLNKGIKGFQQILSSTSLKLEKRRVRELLAASIARNCLTVLFREAHAQVELDGQEVTLPGDALLMQVCQAVADAVPSVSSTEELFLKLSDGVERRDLSAEIDYAMDRLTGDSVTVKSVLEEVWYA